MEGGGRDSVGGKQRPTFLRFRKRWILQEVEGVGYSHPLLLPRQEDP